MRQQLWMQYSAANKCFLPTKNLAIICPERKFIEYCILKKMVEDSVGHALVEIDKQDVLACMYNCKKNAFGTSCRY